MSDQPEEYLFENPSLYDQEWFDMPEFVQEKKEPFAKIVVRFKNEDDLNEFAAIIGQKLTPKTKSIWHPFKSHFREGDQPLWITDES